MTMPSADRPAQEQEVTQAEQLVRHLSIIPTGSYRCALVNETPLPFGRRFSTSAAIA